MARHEALLGMAREVRHVMPAQTPSGRPWHGPMPGRPVADLELNFFKFLFVIEVLLLSLKE